MAEAKVLFVSGDEQERDRARTLLSEQGSGHFDLLTHEHLSDALGELDGHRVDILLYDVEQGTATDSEALQTIRANYRSIYVFLFLPTQKIDLDTIFSSGHFDGCLPKNYENSEQLEFFLRSAMELAASKRALRKTENRFQEYLRGESDWLWEAGEDMAFSQFSDNFERESGQSAESFIGKRLHDLCDLETMGGDVKKFQDRTDSRKPFHEVEFWIRDAGGLYQWFKISGHPVFDGNERFIGYRGAGRDITLEKHEDIELAQNKTTLEKILNSAKEGFLVLSAIYSGSGELADFCVIRLNRAAEEVLGSTSKNLLGKLVRIELPFLVTHGVYEHACHTLETDESFDMEISLEEEKIKGWFTISGVKLSDGVLLTIADVTSRKDAEMEARHTSRLKSVGQLASGIAHEINTPTQYIGDNLGFIQNSLESFERLHRQYNSLVDAVGEAGTFSGEIEAIRKLEEEEDIDFLLEELPQATKQALDGANRVREIVLAMKEFSHPGSQGMSDMDVNRAIETTVTISKNEWKSVAVVEAEFDSSLPHIRAMTSELNQVFLNLIVNSVHAIAELNQEEMGLIRITTRPAGDEQIEIRFTDSGPGMSPDTLEHIFDPFFTTKEPGKGTGQGLSIVHNIIVKKHKGTITCNSTLGEGTEFIIRLPVRGEYGD